MQKPVTARTVADYFGVTVETVQRWVRERSVPFIRVNRKVVRFRLDEVERAVRVANGVGDAHDGREGGASHG